MTWFGWMHEIAMERFFEMLDRWKHKRDEVGQGIIERLVYLAIALVVLYLVFVLAMRLIEAAG